MAGLLETNIVLTNFGTRVFACEANKVFTGTAASLGEGAKEILDILNANTLGYSRETKDYNILANGGWPKKALLNFSADNIQLEMVRTEQGAFNEDSTYWFLYNKLKQYRVNRAFFGIVIVRPVVSITSDVDEYEAVYWTCFVSELDDNASNDSGREYTVSIARSGAPTELAVTYNAEGQTEIEKFQFALKTLNT